MSRFAFDTHTFVKCLTRAGMDEQQAEALVECQVKLINDNLATKQDMEEVKRDIEALRLATEQSIEALRLETKKDIAALKTDMQKMELRLTLRLGSVIIAAVGVFATLIKLLP